MGISQAELARRVGVSQSTVNSLINGDHRSSRSIVQIARELGTTPAFLLGEVDDPDEDAPPPPPAPTVQLMAMPVAMPSGPALMRMFQALLMPLPAGAPLDEIARRLAETLPTGLARLQGELLRQAPVHAGSEEWPSEVPADEAQARPRAQRT